MRRWSTILALSAVMLLGASLALAAALEDALVGLDKLVPQRALAYADARPEQAAAAIAVEQGAADLEEAIAAKVDAARAVDAAALLADLKRLLEAKRHVDRLLAAALEARGEFSRFEPADRQRDALRNYLRVTSQLIDLSGRLDFLAYDAVESAAGGVATQTADRERLLDLLIEYRSRAGAEVTSVLLEDPPADSETAGKSPSAEVRAKVLQLIAVTGQSDLVGAVARYARDQRTPPELVLQAAETIRAIGLPQDPRPGQDRSLPAPPITAKELQGLLLKGSAGGAQGQPQPIRRRLAERARTRAPAAGGDLASRREALLAWLDDRAKRGVAEGGYRLGAFDVEPGDWLLMRNPSPYNWFTDLAPGLFTHVGIVARERGADGIERMVIVDLPERGDHMPATNVDAFVKRTLHYVFLRHEDPAVARKMGEVAASLIGNETQFDLNFRTDRVAQLRGRPLAGAKIHTYCAGLLLLCAQETGRPREEFFPVPEAAAGGQTAANLAKLGMSIGNDFISPTGALCSSHLVIIGRREPTYDPSREIEEAVFDHFAIGLRDKTLSASPDTYQALRLKMAEASKQNPLLAQAIAKAAGVNAQTDLVAAAKAAAVVESLDEVAFGTSAEYRRATRAVMAGPLEGETLKQFKPEELPEIRSLRRRHERLAADWDAERITARTVRVALVAYYTHQGIAQLDQHFFTAIPADTSPNR